MTTAGIPAFSRINSNSSDNWLDILRMWIIRKVQRFSEVTDQLGMAILSVTSDFLNGKFQFGDSKKSVILENPVLPKTSVPFLPAVQVNA